MNMAKPYHSLPLPPYSFFHSAPPQSRHTTYLIPDRVRPEHDPFNTAAYHSTSSSIQPYIHYLPTLPYSSPPYSTLPDAVLLYPALLYPTLPLPPFRTETRTHRLHKLRFTAGMSPPFTSHSTQHATRTNRRNPCAHCESCP